MFAPKHRSIKVTLFSEKHIKIFSKFILTYYQIAPYTYPFQNTIFFSINLKMISIKIPVNPMIRIPTNITLLFKKFDASNTIQPIPDVAATISEATNVVYSTPTEVRSPVKISGRHAGNTILKNTCVWLAPNVLALKI